MKAGFQQTASANDGDQLGFAIFLALAIHALIIFGIGFSIVLTPAPPPILEVTLAQHQSTRAPEQADYLAQVDQLGSGQQSEKNKITSDHLAPLPAPAITPNKPEPSQQSAASAPATSAVITTLSKSQPVTTADQKSLSESDKEEQQRQQVIPQQLASLQAKLDQQRQEFSRLPTVTRITAASTRASPEAGYLSYWIDRIEQIGNSNYPEAARHQQLYGSLQLAVTLARNGAIIGIDILQSSGMPVLDQAATRIVRLAAPFNPLPASVATDHLEIIRTWRFIPGHHLQTENSTPTR